MPRHAAGESEYFSGTFSSKICDKEDSTTSLGCSKISRIEYPPRNVQRPDVRHCIDDGSKVSASVAGEGAGHVLPNSESWPALGNNSDGLKKESGSFSFKSFSPPGYAQILAWGPERNNVYRGQIMHADRADVIKDLSVWIVPTQDGSAVGVLLNAEKRRDAGTPKTLIKTADT